MEKERLHFCIGRFDHYYDSVNNKSSVFLGLATFIVGGLVTGYFSLPDIADCNIWVCSLLILLIVIGIIIMIIVITAATPYLTKDRNSLFYFGSISCNSHVDFCDKSGGQFTDEEEISDLRSQVHQLAVGLAGKFKKLRIAGILFMIQFTLFIPLLILIIYNLK